VLAPWAREHDLDIDDERLLAAYGHHETRIEGETPTAPYPEIVAQSMIAVGKDLGVPVSRADAERLGASVPDWPAFPDSHEALASLAEHYKLLVLSNVDRASFRGSNQRLGVPFTEIITAEDVGSYKPSARNFEVLLARAAERGIASDQLLHVAQSLFHDHSCQGGRSCNGLDQSPPRPARLRRHPRPHHFGHARLGVSFDGSFRRGLYAGSRHTLTQDSCRSGQACDGSAARHRTECSLLAQPRLRVCPLLMHDRIHLELHQPFRVDKAGDFDEGAGRPHRCEAFSMCSGRLAPLPNIDEHHPGPDHVPNRPARFRERLLGNIETAHRLPVHVTGRHGAAVGRDWRGPGHADVRPRPHGAGKANFRFKRRARGHQPAGSSHDRSMPESRAIGCPRGGALKRRG
jgi:2-haloalkanoic acid dehalogenase type II